ncbi:hypothetical protein [Nocardia barduliensis]|uniref:hypothetical protein n=1 Tax=Nocardia barduliensis TaxID=2736643 RepID=UPI001571E8D1|nr:hypothetical protein [Nocardia barduliensis]
MFAKRLPAPRTWLLSGACPFAGRCPFPATGGSGASGSIRAAGPVGAGAASIRGTGMVGAVGGPDEKVGEAIPIGVAGAAGFTATVEAAVETSTTRFAKFGGPSPMLHHRTTRPLGRCSTTMP